MSFTPPKLYQEAFNCPNCNAYANQVWVGELVGTRIPTDSRQLKSVNNNYKVSICDSCHQIALWEHSTRKMLFPIVTAAPMPEEDMPDDLKEDFNEARQILSISPRSSAALLRLVIQKLCKHLGYPGENINDDIKKMIADGLDILVQQAFDVVRVIGNESVHPGQIDLRDDPDTSLQLFNIINFIVEEKITKPRRIREIYSKLPQEKLRQIERRDRR